VGTDINLHAERRGENGWEYVRELNEFEIRNYGFFAILANVRNLVRATEPFDFIMEPRGFPEDMSHELRADSHLTVGHDAGWVSLRELSEFDWDGRRITRTGVVEPWLADCFGDGGQPFPKGRVFGVSQSGPGTRVTWVESYRESAGEKFLDDLLQALFRLGQPDEVRIVFSFDS
jgi:hypothetical protein